MTATDKPSLAATPQVLRPLEFPLQGSSLIEASAGTGKTFTIAMLYVRLVLGHRGADSEARALTPPEILVVTFTDAATKELRDRIRARLIEAAEYFRVDPEEVQARPADEDLLHDLRAAYAEDQWAACARRLQLAAEWMDEAAVSTIHGWCNRMLSEHAFDSDSLFSQTLETDQSELRAEVVRDYWRTFLAPLDAQSASEVRNWFVSPTQLQNEIRGLVAHAELLPEALAPLEALQETRVKQREHLDAIKANWPQWADEIQALFDDARGKKQFKAASLNVANCKRWIDKLRDWANDPEMLEPGFDATAAVWARFTPAGLAEIWLSGEPPVHPAFVAMESLQESLKARPTAYRDVLCHAARWVAQRFAEEEARRSQMGFDDLLTRLNAALHTQNGQRLAEIIRQQYPVALIDEFQDTDPIQYEIFNAVYRIAENNQETAIILIGDPKQAIYAFRGADIYTYLQARRDCSGRLFTLKRNFRSTCEMVAAVNRCFEVAEERQEGEGAFLFRGAEGGDNPLPFIAAEASGRKERLQAEGVDLPALTVWWLPAGEDGKPLSKGAYLSGMAVSCATEMVRLLNLGQQDDASLVGAKGPARLSPADMAVLVNNGTEARAIRAALAERGVRSVYLSDRDSVFKTEQAGELRLWLAACADPDDGRLIRSALATVALGLDWTALDKLNRDELAWEACVLQFRGYRDSWRKRGVLPMLRRLLNDFHVPQRLLGQTAGAAVNGERVLTNLLHLAELLQQASAQLDGEHALIRYLDEQCRDEGGSAGGDARQLRLESDAGLVQVVTVHKSKGLEYPLVFLPFACTYRPASASDMPLKWHDETGKLHINLGDADVVPRVDRERLGEDLRKLYVALTRARYATWVGMAPIANLELSALGYLLNGGKPIVSAELGNLLGALRGEREEISVGEAPVASDEPFVPVDSQQSRGSARRLLRRVRENWWIASYSSLRKDNGVIGGGTTQLLAAPAAVTQTVESREAPETRNEDVFHELLEAEALDDAEDAPLTQAVSSSLIAPALPADETLHGFLRGADAGSFLHDLMEWAANEGFDKVAANTQLVRDTVARRCNLRGWARWIEPLTDWLLYLLRTPLNLPALDGEPVPPVELSKLNSYMAEMEFWLAAHTVDTLALDQLVSSLTLDGDQRPALEPAQLNGMLKGFIDLVFEHDGRYYVADYKSNWLGPEDSAYTSERMRAQILHSRYELQYVLYLFALHRLLKVRLPDYDYDRHVGGAVYLFLRGGRAPGQGLHVERPPRELIEALDELFARRSSEHDATEYALRDTE
ncbi:MAG: exodeoxyribonuclease V subunit beta [Paraburkholderia sp.]|uniref:exodeoxyribonuclease V subunit beta n=1 Tax=Paraburkholderia sp. TaxID=1926495 RepID=UPI003C4E6559